MRRAISDLRWFARRHRVLFALVIVAGAAAVALSQTAGDSDQRPSRSKAAGGSAVSAVIATLRTFPLPDLRRPPAPKVAGARFLIARVRDQHSVELRTAPGGEVIKRLGDTTEFGSPRTFWVERIQGDWLGVPTAELPNGELGWIRDDLTKLDLSETHFWLVAHRAARTLSLNYGKRLLDRYSVTVGRPGSETPLGAFAVTDALAGETLGPFYGCCILALSGRQPNLPAGWIGGDRMAIHGTPGSVGLAASAGCIRASDETMVALLARVPLGAPVYVRP